MRYALLAVPLLPLCGAVAATQGRRTASMALRSVKLALASGLGAAALVAGAAFAGTGTSAVLEADDGRALLGLTADRVGAVLAVLTLAVGFVVTTFAGRSLDGDPRQTRFLALTAALTASTVVVALAATGTLLVIGWIATSATLAALVAHRHTWTPALRAARRTRAAFAVGDVALALAAAVAVVTIGDLDLRSVAGDAELLRTERWDLGALGTIDALTVVAVLAVAAGISRSALVPLHRWLPSTLAAPTPVSALLHAGVVNGIGVLLIRLAPMVGISTPAMVLAFATGAVTAVVATAVMLTRTDAKGALAWSTAGQMGFMTVQIAVGAFAAALFHLVGHALYKAALFLGVGETVSARRRARHRPRPERTVSRAGRVVGSLAAAGVGVGGSLLLFDPHLTTAGTTLVVVFGGLATARAVNGWLRDTPATPPAIGLGLAGGVAGAAAYVGGITLFEHAVAPAVPFEVAAAVGTPVLVATIGAVAAGAATVAWFPGSPGDRLRRRVYVALHDLSTPPPTRLPRRAVLRSGRASSSIPAPRPSRRPAVGPLHRIPTRLEL